MSLATFDIENMLMSLGTWSSPKSVSKMWRLSESSYAELRFNMLATIISFNHRGSAVLFSFHLIVHRRKSIHVTVEDLNCALSVRKMPVLLTNTV